MKLNKFVFLIKKWLKQLIYIYYFPNKKVFFHRSVPYFCQWESKNLVNEIISKKLSAQNDPLWKKSGAKNKNDYELWSWNGCGMACLKMILAHKYREVIPLAKLGKLCMRYGGYVKNKNRLDGLFYKPFLKFIKEEFGLSGKIVSPMIAKDIIRGLEKSNYIIASVSYEIRNPKKRSSFRGGHLVLVLGYDFNKRIFFIHNPSGTDNKTQKYAEVNFNDFNNLFAYRGIIIENT